jgi:hypothetical protein
VARGGDSWWHVVVTCFHRQVCDHTSLKPESLHGYAPGRDGKQGFHLFPPLVATGSPAWVSSLGLQRGLCAKCHGSRVCASVCAFALRGVLYVLGPPPPVPVQHNLKHIESGCRLDGPVCVRVCPCVCAARCGTYFRRGRGRER